MTPNSAEILPCLGEYLLSLTTKYSWGDIP